MLCVYRGAFLTVRQKPRVPARRKPIKGKKTNRAKRKRQKHQILPLLSSVEETRSDVEGSFRFIREHRDRVKQDARLELEKEKLRLEIAALKRAERSGSVEGSTAAVEDELNDQQTRGKHCAQVVAEVKGIRSQCSTRRKTVADVERDHPEFAVWQLVRELPQEDQETFRHPNQWGAAAGYARVLLATFYQKAPDTIKGWIKQYKRTSKPRTSQR